MLHEEYDTDASDEDYVPHGQESDDEVSRSDSDEENAGEDGQPQKRKSRKKERRSNPLLEKLFQTSEKEDNQCDDLQETEKAKQKENSLWADFLADVDEKPAGPAKTKNTSWGVLLGKKTVSAADKNTEKQTVSEKRTLHKCEQLEKEKGATVKITKVFDFAGEEVRLEEEVPMDSREAKQLTAERGGKATQFTAKSLGPGHKRPGGLSELVSVLDSKRKKMSTLEKSRLDWLHFKKEEDITQELESHKKSKDGYLEKQAFLERADVRQFEIEKEMRAAKRTTNR